MTQDEINVPSPDATTIVPDDRQDTLGDTAQDTHTPLVEIENEAKTDTGASLTIDPLGTIAIKKTNALGSSPPPPTLQEVDTDSQEYIIQGKILSKLSTQLRSIRMIFLITSSIYLVSRMLIVSGILSQDMARWVHNLEPGLFMVTLCYIAIWCAFICTGASLRFAFTRYIFFTIALLGSIAFSLWWSDLLTIF